MNAEQLKQFVPTTFPGPISRKVVKELTSYVVMEPYPFAIDIARCEGMYLATLDGQRIFDWAGYYGSKLIGHNHPGLYEPIYAQRLLRAANNKLPNPDFPTVECLAYYRLLFEIAPRCMLNDKLEVYAVNSGAEAVENLMKYLINLHQEKLLARGKKVSARRFIYFDNAFHGRTIFALNVTQISHDPMITEDFAGLVQGNLQVPFPALDSDLPHETNVALARRSLDLIEQYLQRHGDEIVGIILEPIQGAGGHHLAVAEFYRGLSDLAHHYDVYLGFDEVQTAGGQTGTIFAIDQFALPHPPQGVATGKKFGNGVVYMLHPMEDLGVLDSTWGGSLADMVRFVREMEIIRDERLIERVPEKTAVLVNGLRRLASAFPDLIHNVRGLGLYQGFSLRDAKMTPRLNDLALHAEQMLLLGAGPMSIRLRPSLSVSEADIQLLVEKLARCLGELRCKAVA